MIKLVIFDYDGVIVDSFPSVHEVYKVIARKLGKKCPEDFDDFRKFYGYHRLECYKNMGVTEEDDYEKAEIIYREEIAKQNPEPFNGINEIIKELCRKYKVILVSNSPKEEIVQRLRSFGIHDYFSSIFASEDLKPFKKVEVFKEVMVKFSLKPEEIVMIGDRNIDYDKGVKAGLKPENIILVEYGWGYDKNKIPDYNSKPTVNEPKDIIKAISKISK